MISEINFKNVLSELASNLSASSEASYLKDVGKTPVEGNGTVIMHENKHSFSVDIVAIVSVVVGLLLVLIIVKLVCAYFKSCNRIRDVVPANGAEKIDFRKKKYLKPRSKKNCVCGTPDTVLVNSWLY